MSRPVNKTNPRLNDLIYVLNEASRENDANIWREIARRLSSPGKNHAEVNLSKISRYANNGETILVPGKVLGSGVLDRPVEVAALNFSKSASTKIEKANGRCMTIEDLLAANPRGSQIRILR